VVIFIGTFLIDVTAVDIDFKSSRKLYDLFKVKWSTCEENIWPNCCLLGNKTRRVYEGQIA